MPKLNYWNGTAWVELGAGILQGDTEPSAAAGSIWLDTSDTLYQGTIFEPLQTEILSLKNSKAQPNGLASLDGSGQVPTSQLGNAPAPTPDSIIYEDQSGDINFIGVKYKLVVIEGQAYMQVVES